MMNISYFLNVIRILPFQIKKHETVGRIRLMGMGIIYLKKLT